MGIVFRMRASKDLVKLQKRIEIERDIDLIRPAAARQSVLLNTLDAERTKQENQRDMEEKIQE